MAKRGCAGPPRLTERLNSDCFCATVDHDALMSTLDRQADSPGFGRELAAGHPWLFARSPVFVPVAMLKRMMAVVDAVEAAVKLPGYRLAALAQAPEVAQGDHGPAGAFMGYDFHLGQAGPKLIEINTNAGGAFLNAVLAQAQGRCCAPVTADGAWSAFADEVATLFREEWRRQRGEGAPARLAILDDDPPGQGLFAEFRLAQAQLGEHGLPTVIGDPRRLTIADGRLVLDGQPIDLVYNRLVDFWLEHPDHAVLRRAYEDGVAVVTPNPHVYALYADKRNLVLLSDLVSLATWGLPERHAETLRQAVPQTVLVTPAEAGHLWSDRKHWFFKPARGHASKAAYRGDKLTTRVWGEILASQYVAQAYAPPSARRLRRGNEVHEFKMDLRLYVYAGKLLLAAARLYQGQTTNMRTPGGGFAPVLLTEEGASAVS